MPKLRSQLQILLLQIREDADTRAEEFQEFVRYSQLQEDQLTTLNVFDTPAFTPQCVDSFDALFVGGSSDASVLQPDKYPFVTDAKRLLVYCVAQSIPVFASCFGFQVVVEALGGKVIRDQENMEMGVYAMQLTEAAKQDLLFHDLPDGFLAISGHKERAVTLPQEAVLLAATERCPYHALTLPGKPFYGFQFHPEVNKEDLAARITRYQKRYLDHEDHLQTILQGLQDTPEANQLIYKFVDRILLGS